VPFDSNLDKQLVHSTVAASLFGVGAVRKVRLGRFRLVRMLGSGAMGTVFEAHDPDNDDRLAIKVLNELGSSAIYRIKREFRSLAGVVHPNLVVLHELCQEDHRWFFTMELVHGVPFDRWVRPEPSRGLRFDEGRLRLALAGLAAGVQAIHEAGKLHRDLKPGNVLVTDDGTVKVLDFGLMSDKGPTAWRQADSGLMGTPAYMAPESPAFEDATEASDWYAIGVMLFDALTGTLPFQGSPLQLLHDKQDNEAPRADARCRNLPADLVELAAKLLRRDPSARPGASEILEAAGVRNPIQELSLSAPSPAFIGRADELELLRQALGATRAGHAQLVLLGGPSGIGKTALLEHFGAERHGQLVLAGRCYQQESVSYKVFDVVIDALARHLRQMPALSVTSVLPRHFAALEQLFPVLRGIGVTRQPLEDLKDALEQRKRAFGALKELLLRLSDQMPIVITVDDLQWGDADSIFMLRHLFAGPDVPPVLLIGTYRSDELHENDFLLQLLTPQTLGPDVCLQTLEIGPLAPETGIELVRTLSQSAELAASAASIVAESAGIPLFIVELVRLLEDRHGRRSSVGAAAGGASLHELVLQRVNALPSGAQRLLDVISVASGPLEDSIAEQAAQLDDDAGRTFLSLRAARLIRMRRGRKGNVVEIYHDRVRQAVLERMAPDAQSTLHALLAQAMRNHGVEDTERLMAHYMGAGQLVEAGEAALAAGHVAVEKLAFNHAVELFEGAIGLLPIEMVRRKELHLHLAHALANAGQGVRAAAAYLAAASQSPSQKATPLQRMAAQQYLRSGRTKEGWELARRVLANAGVRVPRSQAVATAVLLWERALLRIKGTRAKSKPGALRADDAVQRLDALRDLSPELAPHHLVTGALLQTRYLNEALGAGSADHTLQALAWEVYNASVMGGSRNEAWAADVLEELTTRADQIDTPYARALTHFARSASLLFTARRFGDASHPALRAKEVFAQHCPGAFWERNVVDFFHLVCLEFTGSLSEQLERSMEALRDAKERDDLFLARLMLLSVPYAYLILDQPDAALDFLRRAEESLEPTYATDRTLWLLRMTDVLIYSGRAADGFTLLMAEWPLLARSHIFRSQYIRHDANYFRARCALAAHAEAKVPRAMTVAHDALRALRDESGVFGAICQALTAGLMAEDSAAAQLERACEGLDGAQAPLIASYARRRLCELKRDRGGAAAIDLALQHQGVVNPARWLWTHMPIGWNL
jgi:hypothetical protein